MENTIEIKGEVIKWEYKICPCLDCPIYPTKKEWEEEARIDIRKDICYISRCVYMKNLSASISNEVFDLVFNRSEDKYEEE